MEIAALFVFPSFCIMAQTNAPSEQRILPWMMKWRPGSVTAWHGKLQQNILMFKEQYPQDVSSIPHIGLKPNPAQSDLLSPPTAKVLPEKIHVSVSNLVLPRFISFPFAQPYISTEYNCTRKFDVQIWKAEAHRAYQSWGYMLQNVVWVLHTACELRKNNDLGNKGKTGGQ